MIRLSLASIALIAWQGRASAQELCTSPTNTFTVKVNLWETGTEGFEAGLLGEFDGSRRDQGHCPFR
jgi:hypothetical protein